MKTIKISLNKESIQNAIKELNQYKNDVASKAELLRRRVADEIATLSQAGFNTSRVYDDLQGRLPEVKVYTEESGALTLVIANGEDAVWVEFGSGVYYNGTGASPHPKGNELGLTIGSYGKGYGRRKAWGFYDEDGTLKITRGTPATLPMYNALQSIISKLPEIAREVFQ